MLQKEESGKEKERGEKEKEGEREPDEIEERREVGVKTPGDGGERSGGGGGGRRGGIGGGCGGGGGVGKRAGGGGGRARSEKEGVEERKEAARIGLFQRSITPSCVGWAEHSNRCAEVCGETPQSGQVDEAEMPIRAWYEANFEEKPDRN